MSPETVCVTSYIPVDGNTGVGCEEENEKHGWDQERLNPLPEMRKSSCVSRLQEQEMQI